MYSNSNRYVILPNNSVQNITSDQGVKYSFIQLYGKKSIAYLRSLLLLENNRQQIHFSIDMIMWMLGLKDKRIDRDKVHFKNFLQAFQVSSRIKFADKVNFDQLKNSDFLLGELDIYDYIETKEGKKITNFFILLDSEYETIMNYVNAGV